MKQVANQTLLKHVSAVYSSALYNCIPIDILIERSKPSKTKVQESALLEVKGAKN